MRGLADPKKVKVIHTLADGTVLDSIEGHIVRMEDCPEIYWWLYQYNEKQAQKQGLHLVPPPALVEALKRPRKPREPYKVIPKGCVYTDGR